jgi:hypothetical protein
MKGAFPPASKEILENLMSRSEIDSQGTLLL